MADFKNNSSVSLNFLTFEPTKEKGFTSLFLDFFVKSVTFWHLTRTYIYVRGLEKNCIILLMLIISTLKFNHMLKKSIVSLALVGVVALAAASSGGADNKKSNKAAAVGLSTVKTTPGFSLKAGRIYNNVLSLSKVKTMNFTSVNAVVTYRKGNTIVILPGLKTNVKPSGVRTNLNLVNVKLSLHR